MNVITNFYNVNRIFLSCMGLWPYQKYAFNKVYIVCIYIIFAQVIVYQLMIFITNNINTALLLEVLSTIFMYIIFFHKYNIIYLKADKINLLLERIQRDWDALNDPEEIDIMKRQANIAGWYTKFFMLVFYILTVLFFTMHNLPLILDTVIPLAESRVRRILIVGEIFLDQQKYFHVVLLYIMVPTVLGTTTIIATETLLMILVQHVCGLLKVASYRITCAFRDDNVPVFNHGKKCTICTRLASAVKIHRNAITFVDGIRDCLAVSYIILISFGVASLSINLYRLTLMLAMARETDAFIIFLFVCAHFFYMFWCNYAGQVLINHSANMYRQTYNAQWYTSPVHNQRMLILILRRSFKPPVFGVSNIFVGSLEGFGTLVSMSLSYFTLIYSVR